MNEDTFLEMIDVRRRFPGFELGPLSLKLRRGRIYGLLGPNGAGKTTLLDLVALQLKPTAGTLRADGEPVDWGSQAWKARLSYVREVVGFYDELTAAETLRLASRLYARWDAALAARLTETLELPLDRRVGTLSKGTKVKLGIATALAHHAELLLLDEPTAGLDPTVRAGVQAVIRDLAAERPNLCVLLSSHIFEDIEETATDVLVLRRGRFVFEAPADALSAAALYRTTAAGAAMDAGPAAASRDLLARWTGRGAEWLLVRRRTTLHAELERRADCVEDRPASLLAAVYHGLQHDRGDAR